MAFIKVSDDEIGQSLYANGNGNAFWFKQPEATADTWLPVRYTVHAILFTAHSYHRQRHLCLIWPEMLYPDTTYYTRHALFQPCPLSCTYLLLCFMYRDHS
jgi:hypothetical protein